MSGTEAATIVVGEELPLIESVHAGDGLQVQIVWRGRSDAVLVDLTPDILTFKTYSRLRHDPALFATVAVGDDGNALMWAEGDIEMPATAVERLAGQPISS